MGQSVNLTRHGVNIDELRAEGWEPTADTGTVTETETDAGGGDASLVLVTLAQVAARSPGACLTLLMSAGLGMTEREIARKLRITHQAVSCHKSTLRKHFPQFAASILKR